MVGAEGTPFQIHTRLLCDSSKYFKAAFEGKFKEGEDRVLELLEEDATVFETFQLWLYAGVLDPLTPTCDAANPNLIYTIPLELYVSGDKHHISDLQNDAIDRSIDVVCYKRQFPTSKTA